jgi:hypothetical protein
MSRASGRSIGAGAVTLLVAAALAHPAPTRAARACAASAAAALHACRAGAASDRALAAGRCANTADRKTQHTCLKQAATESKDAVMTCRDQHDARDAVCERLGPGPYTPAIDPAKFVDPNTHPIDNPFFPLPPGTTFVYEGQTAAGLEHDEFAVTHRTRRIAGVGCVEVHDTVTVNGELTEDTLDWFAQDTDGNVWYFGESTQELEGGLPATLEGSWMAGVDGAAPGVVMGAHNKVGDFYRQEYFLGEAEDLAEVVSLTESVTVPASPTPFQNCLKTKETSPLEPDVVENKFYAAGIGNVLTVELDTGERSELVHIIVE